MRLAVFCSGFADATARLQPWLTLLQVGRALTAAGHSVTLVTDGEAQAERLSLPVRRFRSLRGTQSKAIRAWLATESFDAAAVQVTPFSLATAFWYDALPKGRAWAYLPYALYSPRELLRALRRTPFGGWFGYARNLLIPGGLWRRRLASCFAGTLCASSRTARRLGPAGSPRVLPPGVDLDFWCPSGPPPLGEAPLLYMGGTQPVRGYPLLLEAMELLPVGVRLRVLARGLGAGGEAQARGGLASRGLAGRVTLRGGWLSPTDVRDEIRAAAAVVFPFLLVPSEIPVSVMEVVACGTPAVASDIDGLPETIGESGLVFSPGDPAALALALRRLHEDPGLVGRLRNLAREHRREYARWGDVTARWAQILAGHEP